MAETQTQPADPYADPELSARGQRWLYALALVVALVLGVVVVGAILLHEGVEDGAAGDLTLLPPSSPQPVTAS